MKKIVIEEKKNGWSVKAEGFIRINGEYVFKATEILGMLEFVGEHINERKIKIEER
jgi:hypothetical protein